MTPLLDTDLLRVNRGGVDYQATWLEVKAGVPAPAVAVKSTEEQPEDDHTD